MKDENIEDIYELSPMQQGMLFHTLAAPNSGVYFEQSSYILQGKLDVLAFKRSWKQVVNRHPVLRTSFHWERLDNPYQVVYRQVDLPWEQQDWRELSTQEQQKHLEAFLKADRERGFELSQVPLIRMALFQITEDTYQFVQSHHHLLMDGWSWWGQIVKEVYSFYNAFCQRQELDLERPHPYRDYIAWLQQQDLSKAEEFWRQRLKGFTVPTPLGVDRAPGSIPSQDEDYDRQWTLLSQPLTACLQSIARQHQLTLNTLLQGAWALLLSRYSGSEDVVFGATSSGRPAALEGVESMVGLFINTLPLRVQVPPEAFVFPWLKQLQTQQLEVSEYEYSPLVQIMEWSQIPRGLPLFESIYVFNNYIVNSSKSQLSASIEISHYRAFEKTNYPLTFVATPATELRLEIKYDTRRFEADTIGRMLGHLQSLLEGIVANPEQRLSSLPLLTAAERHQLLVEWNDIQAEYPQDKCIHELFEAQVERSPDAIAVVFEDSVLTYWELNARANRIAHHLQTLGVGPEVLVGICVERSLEMVVGLLGILKAGGAYVPLDPAYPQARLTLMLKDAGVSVLLTQRQMVETLPPHQAKVICLDTDWDANAYGTAAPNAQESDENPVSGVTSENLAYVNYTSGSTGQPKGVEVLHRGVVRLLFGVDYVHLDAAQRFLQMAPISFDASTFEVWGALLHGASCVLFPGNIPTSKELGNALQKHGITTLWLTATLFNSIIDDAPEVLSGVRQLLIGGEALSVAHVLRAQEILPSTQIINGYGPTESTTFTCCYPIPKRLDDTIRSIPIGRPIGNTQVYLLDAQLLPVPIGVPGELHVSGDGLARGYLNRPELTEEKFILNPFSNEPRARLYKTGDLVRYLPDGNIEFLGRIDNQVKIRGFRIELCEIEAVLSQHQAVLQNVVIVREDVPGDKRLVAYLVAKQKPAPTLSNLRRFLKEQLPDYMIPSACVLMEALPLTPNGKVDSQALPVPDQGRPQLEVAHEAPQTELEQTIANVWQEVLHVDKVGIHDNFFDLGGHSLLLIKVHSRLKEICGQDFSVVTMFQYPTISHLTLYFGQKQIAQFASPQNSETSASFIDSIERRKQLRQKLLAAMKPRDKSQ